MGGKKKREKYELDGLLGEGRKIMIVQEQKKGKRAAKSSSGRV